MSAEDHINYNLGIMILPKYYEGYNGDIMGNTTIAINNETKKALQELGMKGETYDSIIKNLLQRFAWKKLDDKWNKILAEDEFIPLDEL